MVIVVVVVVIIAVVVIVSVLLFCFCCWFGFCRKRRDKSKAQLTHSFKAAAQKLKQMSRNENQEPVALQMGELYDELTQR